jgi:predicted permease
LSVALLLFPDFALILLGGLLKRYARFDLAFWTGLERIVYFVLFPALLFRALATSTLSIADGSRLVVVGLLFTAAGMLLSALAKPLLHVPHATFAACFQCGFRFNTYIALAAASRLGGEAAVAAISLLIGVLVPIVNVAAVAMLAPGRGKALWLAVARNPLVIACVAGLAWKALALPLPDVASKVLEHLAAAALPLGLVAAGAGLEFAAGTLPLRAVVWWNVVKLAALPAIALALASLLGVSPLERQVAVLLAAVPTAPSSYILAMQMTGGGAPVALLISSGTLLAILTLPLWLAAIG